MDFQGLCGDVIDGGFHSGCFTSSDVSADLVANLNLQ